jgi:flagellar FliJ protein
MSALRSIRLAIDLATRKRDDAHKGFMQVQRSHLFAQDQMAQLENYAKDTEVRWTRSAQVSATPELLGHHYQFMGRLRHAIDLQRIVLIETGVQLDQAKKNLLDAEFRVFSLEHVLKKKQIDALAVQSRKEQKQMDEFAALQHFRSNTRHPSGEYL